MANTGTDVWRRLVVASAALMTFLVGCGGSDTAANPSSTFAASTSTTTTTTPPETTATEPTATSSAPDPEVKFAEFTADSGNIACYMTTEVVSCWISEKDWEIDQPEDCEEQDFGNAIDLSNGEVSWPCYTDFAWNPFADPLGQGESISVGSYGCTAAPAGVACEDTDGGRFELSGAEVNLERPQ